VRRGGEMAVMTVLRGGGRCLAERGFWRFFWGVGWGDWLGLWVVVVFGVCGCCGVKGV
jgi:hypothetical protein